MDVRTLIHMLCQGLGFLLSFTPIPNSSGMGRVSSVAAIKCQRSSSSGDDTLGKQHSDYIYLHFSAAPPQVL